MTTALVGGRLFVDVGALIEHLELSAATVADWCEGGPGTSYVVDTLRVTIDTLDGLPTA
ncbi:MAG: hypothetical protein WCK81_15430 [Betaproteobacteria bacterium]